MTTSKEALQNYLDSLPHVVMHIETGWRSQPYKNRSEAEKWLELYGVTQEYKERCYKVVLMEG
jgi:hypothetical protein